MYKTNTGKYCHHCGADIHTHSMLDGREITWYDVCSDNCVTDITIKRLNDERLIAINKLESLNTSIAIARTFRTNEAKLAEAVRLTEAVANECGVSISQLASNLGKKEL